MISGPVVSNTTPLINLAGIAQLEILAGPYGGITMPSAVADEYQAKAPSSDPDVTKLPWITIVHEVPIEPSLPQLGAGEAEAISLAKRLAARIVLIDERKARGVAVSHGLVPVGTLAVLVRAKKQGIIPSIGPLVERMQTQGRYFGDALIEQILRAVDE